MFHQSIIKLVISTSVIAISVGALSFTAQGQVVGVCKTNVVSNTCCRNADFGSGFHLNGFPTGLASVTWDYTPQNGPLIVRARVVGTLYLDSIFGSCCERLKIEFMYVFSGIGKFD